MCWSVGYLIYTVFSFSVDDKIVRISILRLYGASIEALYKNLNFRNRKIVTIFGTFSNLTKIVNFEKPFGVTCQRLLTVEILGFDVQ